MHKAPQFELPGQTDVFNLAGEATADPDRLARETATAAAARDEAKRREATQQTTLFPE